MKIPESHLRGEELFQRAAAERAALAEQRRRAALFPELVEALNACVEAMLAYGDAVDGARAVLAKAKGETK